MFRFRRSIEDIEDGALAVPRTHRCEESAERACGAAVSANHFAEIALLYAELVHRGAIGFDDMHLDGVRLVDQRTRHVFNQLAGSILQRDLSSRGLCGGPCSAERRAR